MNKKSHNGNYTAMRVNELLLYPNNMNESHECNVERKQSNNGLIYINYSKISEVNGAGIGSDCKEAQNGSFCGADSIGILTCEHPLSSVNVFLYLLG